MKSNFFYLCSLICILLISCNKNDSDNDTPPVTTRDWFKLKTKLMTSTRNGSPYSNDSTSIEIDSVNNKIVFKRIGIYSGTKDTTVDTYTYNSNNQLVLYEHVTDYYELYISRMQFVRDANGQVTKVLSEYKNGLMASSEGSVKYDKRGDTTFITYLDSAKKHKQNYYDGQDYYQVGLLGNRIVYSKSYSLSTPGKLDSSQNKYEYDAAGNLTTVTSRYNTTTPVAYSYQRGSEQPKDLQKFMAQWGGDLAWFTRVKLFYFSGFIGNDYHVEGNVLQSIKKDNAAYRSYTNGFDANGNLSSITFQTITSATFTTTQQYKYRP
jgi:YD repeat-containing protein